MKYKANKTDKIKHIVCALYNMKELPSVDHWKVKQMKRTPLSEINIQFEIAKKIILNRKE